MYIYGATLSISVLYPRILIIFELIAISLHLIFTSLLLYLSTPKRKIHLAHYHATWKDRLKYFTSKYAPNEDVIQDVAWHLAEYFHDMDWSLTDLFVALVLIKREQKLRRDQRQELRRKEFIKRKESIDRSSGLLAADIVIEPIRKKEFTPNYPPGLDLTSLQESKRKVQQKYGYDLVTRYDILDILHFSKYAELIYLPNDARAQLGDAIILYKEENELHTSPFLVAIDPLWKSIVIAIRGTYSLIDWVVDLDIELEVFSMPEVEGVHYVHQGILRTAMKILQEIEKDAFLPSLLKEKEGYDIVVTGHSLGGGAGALLAYFLRHIGYEARCYAYDPPGQLLTPAAAEYLESFTCSVVNGDDLVARLSRNSMEVLKIDIERVLRDCDIPKYRILGDVLRGLCCGRKQKWKRPDIEGLTRTSTLSSISKRSPEKDDKFDLNILSRLLSPLSPTLQAEIRAQIAKVKTKLKSLDPTVPTIERDHGKSILPQIPTYLPGRILYLEKCRLYNDEFDKDLPWTPSRFSLGAPEEAHTRAGTSGSVLSLDEFSWQTGRNISFSTTTQDKKKNDNKKPKYAYTPRWASREEFQDMLISRSSISDHFPFPNLKVLTEIDESRKLRVLRDSVTHR